MLSKALEMGVCFRGEPVLWNMGGRSFPRAFERRVIFFTRRTFIEEFERYITECSGTGKTSPQGSQLGTFEKQTKEGSGNAVALIKLI